ncbi:hypothetical protein Ancab_037262 [Ancistrocladus abbreviatus]
MPPYYTIFSPPPPFIAVGQTMLPPVGGSSNNNGRASTSSFKSATENLSPSILITVLVLATAVILSASLYLLLRFLNRHCSSSRTSQVDAFDTFGQSHHNHNHNNNRHHHHHYSNSRQVSPEENNSLIDSLPLFTFGSISRHSSTKSTAGSGGDCAVCLSKFELHDQLRLLPICCHAFHARCIDTWLAANQTCPLCRSPIFVSESELLSKTLMNTSSSGHNSGSFRIEIGSVSRRRLPPESGEQRRSYSIGSFDYIVDEALSEVTVGSMRQGSDYSEKDEAFHHEALRASERAPEPPGQSVAAEVGGGGGGRSWLKDYVERLGITTSFSLSSSFRSSGRFFTGSSGRSELNVARDSDLEASRLGEEIGEMFRWLSGV